MKTRLIVDVDYNPDVTDPEGLAVAADRLMETICSTPGILDDYDNPILGEFFVAGPAIDFIAAGPQRVVVNVYGGVVQDVFCSDPHARAAIVDWDNEGRDPSEDGIVEVQMEDGGKTPACVADYPTQPLKNLPGTDVEKALRAAKLAEDWFAPSKPEPSSDSDLLAMCRQVADTAENWADCFDMKEAMAVFKELGQKCRAAVDRYSPRHITRRYVLYDYDEDSLATTNVYDSYSEAADDASQLNNVMILVLDFETVEPSGRGLTDTVEGQPSCSLNIDGPQLRAQRALLLKLLARTQRLVSPTSSPDEKELLEGLINLTDKIAAYYTSFDV